MEESDGNFFFLIMTGFQGPKSPKIDPKMKFVEF